MVGRRCSVRIYFSATSYSSATMRTPPHQAHAHKRTKKGGGPACECVPCVVVQLGWVKGGGTAPHRGSSGGIAVGGHQTLDAKRSPASRHRLRVCQGMTWWHLHVSGFPSGQAAAVVPAGPTGPPSHLPGALCAGRAGGAMHPTDAGVPAAAGWRDAGVEGSEKSGKRRAAAPC